MSLFTKGTVFVETKNENFTEEVISELENIREMAMGKGKEKVFQKIDSNYQRILKGKKGEEKLRKELMLSGIDMFVLYDIYLSFEYNGYTLPERQIDYLIITKKNLYILECKNMYTDIRIDKYGSFFYIDTNKSENRILSPIAQVHREIETAKKAIEKEKHSLFEKIIIKSLFKKNCKHIVVWTNEKSGIIVEDSIAERFRKEIVYIDHFNEWLRQTEKKTKTDILSRSKKKFLYSLKDFYREQCKQRSKKLVCNCKNDLKLYFDLDEFRNERVKEEKTEHYKIFKNDEMISLIEKRPKSKGGLQSMKFPSEWIAKYGEEVLEILNKDVE